MNMDLNYRSIHNYLMKTRKYSMAYMPSGGYLGKPAKWHKKRVYTGPSYTARNKGPGKVTIYGDQPKRRPYGGKSYRYGSFSRGYVGGRNQRRYGTPKSIGAPKNTGEPSQKTISQIAKEMMGEPKKKVGNTHVTVVDAPTLQDKDSGGDKIPLSHTHTIHKHHTLLSGLGVNRTVAKSVVITGYPSTKKVRDFCKINGEKRVTLYDTKINMADPTAAQITRPMLTHSYGFNGKNWYFLPAISYTNIKDIFAIAGLAQSDKKGESEVERIYMMFKWVESQFSIYNQSAFFPMHFRIHLVKFMDSASGTIPSTRMGFGLCSNSLSVQQDDRIPIWYQKDLPVEELNSSDATKQMNVDVSLKASFKDSPAFNRDFQIVKTFSKKIDPNGTWRFRHRHQCGPGIEIQGLMARNGLAPADGNYYDGFGPIGYMYIFESFGIQTEGVYGGDFGTGVGNQVYQGTSPGWYHIEFRKTLKFGVDPQGAANMTSTGFTVPAVGTRLYVRDDNYQGITSNRDFYVPSNKIKNTRVGLGETELYVPVLSDKVTTETTTTGGVND